LSTQLNQMCAVPVCGVRHDARLHRNAGRVSSSTGHWRRETAINRLEICRLDSDQGEHFAVSVGRGTEGGNRESGRNVKMKTILVLAMSLAMTGAALAQGGSGNGHGWPSDPRLRGTYMDPRYEGVYMMYWPQHLGPSTLPPGHRRLYGTTSGPREAR
jgi:hypothetical protein